MYEALDDRSKYRFQEILESIDYIEEWAKVINTPDDFLLSMDGVMRLNACIMRIQVIGEHVGKLLKSIPKVLDEYKEIPWLAIYDMRNLISHEYSNVDETIVFETIKKDLPALRNTIQKMFVAFNNLPTKQDYH